MDDPGPSGLVVLVSNRQDRPVDIDGLTDLAQRVLAGEGRQGGELSISFVTTEEIAALHERYMDEAGPTDVLSFPLDEDGLIGDVVIAPETAAKNNPNVDYELRLLD